MRTEIELAREIVAVCHKTPEEQGAWIDTLSAEECRMLGVLVSHDVTDVADALMGLCHTLHEAERCAECMMEVFSE